MLVTAFLMGGLGNQMFQISNAISYSLDNGYNAIFNSKSFTPLQGNDTSNYVSNIFKNINFTNNKIVCDRYNEISWEFYEKQIQTNNNIEFYGYYQSSKNFLKHKKVIMDLFSPNNKEINFLIEKYPEIKLEKTLSLHVRRGDYINSPKVHPVISKSYIEESIKQIGDYSHLFIFTDDKKWVLENLNYNNLTIVDDKDYNEMWLMSLCKNNIISNSTFSWWGSFLNKNQKKIVIAPSIWFGENGPINYKDLYEDNWKIVDVEVISGELKIKK
jgi:hypothetical protein